MKSEIVLRHEFVEFIPEQLAERTLYVSIRYATAAHKCCCGCGKEVVTPLSPTDWELIFDGKSVSLYPSIGNWGFACRSHYWIRNNRVHWALPMSPTEIAAGRAYDRMAKERYFHPASHSAKDRVSTGSATTDQSKEPIGFWRLLSSLWRKQ